MGILHLHSVWQAQQGLPLLVPSEFPIVRIAFATFSIDSERVLHKGHWVGAVIVLATRLRTHAEACNLQST
jgi:hypothetical protein